MTVIRHQARASTQLVRLPAGARIEPHRHEDNQIVYAGRGVLAVRTGAGSWIAPANRAIWVPAGTVHQHTARGTTDLRAVGLPLTANPLGLDRPTVLLVGPLLRQLLIAYTDHDDRESLAGQRMLAVLLDELRASPQRPVHLPLPADPRLSAVCDLLSADPADPRSLPDFGAATGLSARTLSRLFRTELGMTFPQWRTQLRLHHALLLLAEGMAVTTVAHRCGWSSTSAFIDVFRAAFGHTPGMALRN